MGLPTPLSEILPEGIDQLLPSPPLPLDDAAVNEADKYLHFPVGQDTVEGSSDGAKVDMSAVENKSKEDDAMRPSRTPSPALLRMLVARLERSE